MYNCKSVHIEAMSLRAGGRDDQCGTKARPLWLEVSGTHYKLLAVVIIVTGIPIMPRRELVVRPMR